MTKAIHDAAALCAVFQEVAQEATRPFAEREEAFMAIGQGIFALHGQVREMGTLAEHVAQEVCGKTAADAVAQLGHELELLREAISRTQDDSGLLLERTAATVQELPQGALGLGRLVRTLKMLGIAVKIESARIGEAGRGFAALAEDVDNLTRRIPELAQTISAQATATAKELQCHATLVRERQHKERTHLASLFHQIHEEGRTLQTLADHSLQCSRQTNDTVAQVTAHMNELVALVQSHDMGRQRMEHVAEALRDALAFASAERDQTALMVELGNLQVRHITACAQDIGDAVHTMEREAQVLAELAGSVFHEASTWGAGEWAAALTSIKTHLAALMEHLHAAASAQSSLQELMAQAKERLMNIQRLVEDIEDIGAEIELIALNASIRASRTGDVGRALGVIASAIQETSVEARRQTGGLAHILEAIAQATSHLTLEKEGPELLRIPEHIQRIVEQLEVTDQTTQQAVGRLADHAQLVARTSADLVAQIQRQLDVGEAISRLGQRVEHALAPWQDMPELAALRQSHQWDTLLSRYTMERERHVHHGTDATTEDMDDGSIELF